MKALITGVHARQILDSRGTPTLAVTVRTKDSEGSFGVPSGASTGSHEAHELRDGDPAHFEGKGVLKAMAHVNGELDHALRGMDARDQRALDERMMELDGTPNKSRLGGNAIVGVSVAVAKAAAQALNIPVYEHLRTLSDIRPTQRVPFLCMNLMNGGKHAAGRLAFQEYKVVPQTDSIVESLEMGTSIMHHLRARIAKELGPVNANVGDEGGFAPDIEKVRRPLELFMETITELGYNGRVKLAMDVAASSFYQDGHYAYEGHAHTPAELERTLRAMVHDFPFLYIEDPFNEDAWDDFARINDGSTIIMGDDLTVTNPERLAMAIEKKAISAVLIKVNQVGTLTQTLDCMKLARDHGLDCVVSHRSGETNDDFIADLAVAFGVLGVKAGGPQRGERIAKYNRFLEILEK